MTRTSGVRISVALAAIVILGGSLTGCARGALAGSSAPAAGVTANTAAPAAPTPAASDPSLGDIQNDLNSADSSTSNANGDVTDADNSAATNDSP